MKNKKAGEKIKSKRRFLPVVGILIFAFAIVLLAIINFMPGVYYGPRNASIAKFASIKFPDLISSISNVNINCENISGNCLCNVNFDVTIKNVGNADASTSTTRIALVGSYDLTSMVTTPSLKPNQNVTSSLVMPGSIPAGNYNLSSYADWYKQVVESNENNNDFTTSFDVHC